MKKRANLFVQTGPEGLKWAITDASTSQATLVESGFMPASRTPEDIAKELSSIAKKNGVVSLLSSLARNQVTARTLEIPSISAPEIQKIVELQAVKQTPYSSEEIVFDFYPLFSKR